MSADVCLVLEGTYPFVRGGVSSWVHHLVSALAHLRFAILHITPRRGYYERGPLYQVPDNVVSIDEVYLHDYSLPPLVRSRSVRRKVQRFRSFVQDMLAGETDSFARFLEALDTEAAARVDAASLLQSPAGWDVLVDAYRAEAHEESFLNFFWTWRYAFMPLFNVLRAPVPEASAYHTVSTGYAGLIASACKVRSAKPVLLTEHGIYTKERRIEINRCEWIDDWHSGEVVAERNAPYFRRYWVRQFEMMSRICYEHADRILTLYGGNRELQLADGADAEKIEIVPNGIDVARFALAAERRAQRSGDEPFTVGFVGRVCPIKDIKTLVYAMRLVADEVPGLRVRVMGPTDEDPDYAQECRDLAALLDLDGIVDFEGSVSVVDELHTLDCLVLTSISEAQPLVVLEAGAAGVPVVATDVGACQELLFGRTLEDRELGQGGIVTPIATPGATAEAVLQLWRDPAFARRLGDNLRARVERHYDQREMVAAYHRLYARHLQLEGALGYARGAVGD